MNRLSLLMALFVAAPAFAAATEKPAAKPAAPADPPKWATKDLNAGIIGTDTSHVPAFVQQFNKKHPEWRIKIVCAFKGGSPDLPTSADRVEKFAKTIHDDYGIELVDSIDALLAKVDVVLLESVDGRPHLSQVTPVFKAHKPVFIDKPLAASLEDARKIVALSKETGTPFFSSSSYRFHPDMEKLRKPEGIGHVVRVQASSPFNKLMGHPDLYFYGIHGVEALYAVMGPGCVSVTRTADKTADVTTGTWKDGRIGQYYGPIDHNVKMPMIHIWGDMGEVKANAPAGYEGLDQAVAEFFHTGKPPVDPQETLELFEFMTAAQQSFDNGGKEVKLSDLRK
jgi:predicted dehydrogenase